MENSSLYLKLGDDLLHLLIDEFYHLILSNASTAPLFNTDINIVKAKQFAFLTQFFGGPPRYLDEYGHPMMRARHLQHEITRETADQWLICMARAIDKLPIDKELKVEIYERFPPVAAHMINS
jgi:hemoglobin